MARLGDIQVALLATILNYLTYSLWTMANKWQFNAKSAGGFGVTAPLLVTAFQMLVAGFIAFVAVIGFGFQRSEAPLLTRGVLLNCILPLGLSRAIDIGCGNTALSLVTVAVQQVIKSTLPVFVSVLSILVLGKFISSEAWASLVPIVAGTVLATVGELNFSAVGVTLAVISCFGRAFKAVLNAKLLHAKQDRLAPLQILLLEAPTTGLMILIPSLWFERGAIVDTWSTTLTPSLGFNVLCGALMFINQATYITIIEHTSAVSCQVLMNVKMLLLILVSIRVFDTHLLAVNWIGLFVATMGCFCYSRALARATSAGQKREQHTV